jgi:hypothetical protein
LPEVYHASDEYDPEQLFEREAKEAWHTLLTGSEDVSEGVRRLFSRYGSYTPRCFESSGRQRTRRGFELIRGSARNPDENAGPLGRLAFIADGRLEFRTLSMSQIELGQFEGDATAQFCSSKLKAVKKALKKVVSGAFVATVERGRVAEKVHVHLVCVAGSCAVGRRSQVDIKTLPKLAAYIVKKPLYTRENAVSYVETLRAQKNPGRRLIRFGLGRKVSVRQVEKLLGISVLKPQKEGSVQNRVQATLVFLPTGEKRSESNLYGIAKAPCSTYFLPVQHPGTSPPAATLIRLNNTHTHFLEKGSALSKTVFRNYKKKSPLCL